MNRLAVWVFISTILNPTTSSKLTENPDWLNWLIGEMKRETKNLNSNIYRYFWKDRYYFHIEVFLASQIYHQVINSEGQFLYWPKEIFDVYQVEKCDKTIVWEYLGATMVK